MAQGAFYFNMNDCTGCKCCEVACKDKNELPIGTFFRRTTDYEGGLFPAVWSATLTNGCNQCDNPACVAACPVGAIVKESKYGAVVQDHEACIGCQACVEACPYGQPVYFADEGKTRKCDSCIQWLENGMQPACVGACSTRALKWGPVEEMAAMPGATRDIPVLPSSELTGPNAFIFPKPEMA